MVYLGNVATARIHREIFDAMMACASNEYDNLHSHHHKSFYKCKMGFLLSIPLAPSMIPVAQKSLYESGGEQITIHCWSDI